MAASIGEDKWAITIQQLFTDRKLTSHQCILYHKGYQAHTEDEKCGCQRPIRHHSFDGTFEGTRPNPKDWNVKDYTKKLQKLIYHSTPSRKFLRCACESKDDIATLYELMRSVCEQPKLIISVYGGRKHFTMSEDIEKEFMDSLAEAAMTSGTWIITSGLNNGAARLIGEGVGRLRALTDTKQPTTLLGISWWGNVTEKTRKMVLDLQREDSVSNNDMMNSNTAYLFDEKDEGSLEKNHTHFLLLDDGRYKRSQSCNETNEQSMFVTSQRSESVGENQQHQRESLSDRDASEVSSKQQHTTFAKTTKYPKEVQRVDFVDYACQKDQSHAVTIIVEGGINTCEAVLSEIQMKRPVIFIQGSGKIADIIASLLELTAKNDYTPARLLEPNEIEHNLRRFPMRARTKDEHEKLIEQIREIMHPDRRRYLTVFRINSDLNLKQTMCYAIFKAHFAQTDLYKSDNNNDVSQSRDENLQRENLLELAVKWDCFDQATDLLADLQYMKTSEPLAKLFKQALDENRPAFVDYFLRINYDPRRTLDLIEANPPPTSSRRDSNNTSNTQNLTTRDIMVELENQIRLSRRGSEFIFQLYENPFNSNTQPSAFKPDLHLIQPRSEDELNIQYRKWIGSFMWPVFGDLSEFHPNVNLHTRHFDCCKCKYSSRSKIKADPTYNTLTVIIKTDPTVPSSSPMQEKIRDGTLAEKLTQAMLRDLLYWSIFTDRIDMAKVLLLHIRTRICAALSCAAILRNLASEATTGDQGHRYKQQAKDFEMYATECINACYSKSERKACELLIREQPLFGEITCMQVAISSRSKFFINTHCFEQVLNRIWYNKISRTDKSFFWILKFAISFWTLGLLAPRFMPYCPAEDMEKDKLQEKYQTDVQQNDNDVELSNAPSIHSETMFSSQLSSEGVNYYTQYRESSDLTRKTYAEKLLHFHQCPMVKMFYHFIGHFWLLLVFSYMVLFKLVPPSKTSHTVHWTEIYTIITISTMFIENIRKSIFYHVTYMREGQQHTRIIRLMISLLREAPYILFLIGMICWCASGDSPRVFTAARIILALDLELWYLWSLKFITVIKILSPKVFMMRNMLRDLFGFLYVAFICIAAYGVASRAMIKQDEVTFSLRSIFANIFYAPYWLLYADAEDEKKTLDDIIIANNSANLGIEAIATHGLLAFHMLFFNILLLNLLIAVFATTINAVENNAKYFYHHQRYILTQEYFEKPIIPVPPLILIWYLVAIARCIWYRLIRFCKNQNNTEKDEYNWSGIFKMIPIDPKFTERCTAFEHAVTYDYARRVVEDKKKK